MVDVVVLMAVMVVPVVTVLVVVMVVTVVMVVVIVVAHFWSLSHRYIFLYISVGIITLFFNSTKNM